MPPATGRPVASSERVAGDTRALDILESARAALEDAQRDPQPAAAVAQLAAAGLLPADLPSLTAEADAGVLSRAALPRRG
jgi:hypothetical protein